MSEMLRFYVVVCNRKDRSWRSSLFADTIAGPLAYEKRTDADNAAAKARVMYGWAKVLRCVREAE